MTKLTAGFLVLLMVAAFILADSETKTTHALNPGATAAPLLSCPDVSGVAPVSLFDDIFVVANRYGAAAGQPNYQVLFDVADANGTIDLFNDIFHVANNFGVTCPTVDLQIAKATQAILNDPQAASLLACDPATLNARGYFRAGSDVPGQGVHYLNVSLWDGVFNVTQPEGLVCQGGKLAAELYVVNGNVVGWGPFTPGGGSAMHSVNIDTFCTPPSGQTICSWDGPETWHAHANLCLYHIGTPSSAITITADAAACQAINGTGTNWVWAAGIGWMGHLWNFVPNENQVSDVNGTMNGRFADCRPPFKAETCPM
jgi:hypothetical protein